MVSIYGQAVSTLGRSHKTVSIFSFTATSPITQLPGKIEKSLAT
jgi:hypothetical protein